MNFILENSSIIAMIVLVLLTVGVGYFLIPYLVKVDKITDQNIQGIIAMINVAQLISDGVNLEKNSKEKTELILNISEKVVRYVEQTMTLDENKDKKDSSVALVIEMLGYMNVSVSDKEKELIELGIESAITLLPKTHIK